jgi:hypothetical protein
VDASINERATLFPDGGNEHLPNNVSDFIWTVRYLDSFRIAKQTTSLRYIRDMKVRPEYNVIRDYFRSKTVPISCFSESHVYIYDFIKRLEWVNVEIINIDHHHDMYSYNNSDINCGNWLTSLINEGICTKAVWIKNEDSCEGDMKECDILTIHKDIKKALKITNYDAVFLCRSRTWSPPHLDTRFISLMKFIEDRSMKKGKSYNLIEIRKNRFEKQKKLMENEQDRINEELYINFVKSKENDFIIKKER